MVKRKKKGGKLSIDLQGPQGNAFFILGTAKNLSGQLGKDFDDINKKMTSGDYENLIKMFDDEFGEYVDLYRVTND